VVRSRLVTHKMAQHSVEAYNVKVVVAARPTLYACEQTIYQLLRTLAAIGTLTGQSDGRQRFLEMTIVKHFVKQGHATEGCQLLGRKSNLQVLHHNIDS